MTLVDELYDATHSFVRGKMTRLLLLPSIINRIIRATFFPRGSNNDEIYSRAWNIIYHILKDTKLNIVDFIITEMALSKRDMEDTITICFLHCEANSRQV